MSNEQDILIWKLNEELVKARLALGKIYEIIDKTPFWTRELAEIAKTLQEFFGSVPTEPTKKEG